MSATCDTGSCKLSDAVWALTNGNKVHRLTFSKNLADLLAEKTGYKVERKHFVIGKKLEPG